MNINVFNRILGTSPSSNKQHTVSDAYKNKTISTIYHSFGRATFLQIQNFNIQAISDVSPIKTWEIAHKNLIVSHIGYYKGTMNLTSRIKLESPDLLVMGNTSSSSIYVAVLGETRFVAESDEFFLLFAKAKPDRTTFMVCSKEGELMRFEPSWIVSDLVDVQLFHNSAVDYISRYNINYFTNLEFSGDVEIEGNVISESTELFTPATISKPKKSTTKTSSTNPQIFPTYSTPNIFSTRTNTYSTTTTQPSSTQRFSITPQRATMMSSAKVSLAKIIPSKKMTPSSTLEISSNTPPTKLQRSKKPSRSTNTPIILTTRTRTTTPTNTPPTTANSIIVIRDRSSTFRTIYSQFEQSDVKIYEKVKSEILIVNTTFHGVLLSMKMNTYHLTKIIIPNYFYSLIGKQVRLWCKLIPAAKVFIFF